MTEVATTPTAAEPAEDKEASIGKTAIYEEIAELVKAKTGKNIGKSGGHAIFDLVTKGVFTTAAKEGTFRFNGGHGSLHVRTYKDGKRKLPNGTVTEFGKRRKLRYEEGVTVTNLVKAAEGASTGDGLAPAVDLH